MDLNFYVRQHAYEKRDSGNPAAIKCECVISNFSNILTVTQKSQIEHV